MSERSAKPRALRYIVYLAVIGIVIVGGYYGLFYMTVNNFELKVDYFEFKNDVGYLSMYSIDVNMTIKNDGFLTMRLSERETSLYINGINVGSLSFSESWESYSSGSTCTYSGTYFTTDSEDAEKLCEDIVYDMILKLKAKASSGPFYTYVEVRDDHSFNVEYYMDIIECASCDGEGWIYCFLCIDGDNVCYQCDETGWDECWYCEDGKADCYACEDGIADCYVCEDGIAECYICDDGKADCYLCADGCSYCDYKGWNTCTFCDGQGWYVCNFCNSQGWNVCNLCNSQGWNTCTFCNGNGGEICSGCGGEGFVDCYYCEGEGGWICTVCEGDGLVESSIRNAQGTR